MVMNNVLKHFSHIFLWGLKENTVSPRVPEIWPSTVRNKILTTQPRLLVLRPVLTATYTVYVNCSNTETCVLAPVKCEPSFIWPCEMATSSTILLHEMIRTSREEEHWFATQNLLNLRFYVLIYSFFFSVFRVESLLFLAWFSCSGTDYSLITFGSLLGKTEVHCRNKSW
jgi:hypothetical protein